MSIRTWSTTSSANNAAPPNGWPEGMAPSAVNNTARQLMADIRSGFEEAPFFDYGHTPTRVDDDTFTVPTDLTALYTVNRRLKIVGSTTGYASVASSSYSAPNTTVNVVMDSSVVPTSPVTVSLGPDPGVTGSAIVPYFKRTSAEIGAAVTPTNYVAPSYDALGYSVPDRYVSAGAVVTAAAIQTALDILPRGGTCIVTVPAGGIAIGENTITVPVGRHLVVRRSGLPLSKFSEGGSLGLGDEPDGGVFIITSTSLPPIALRSNASVSGITFWYPNQNWDITSLAESFTTYPAAIQIGDSTDTGPSHPSVSYCQFIGATRCISQYSTDGTSIRGLTVEHCTGALLGDFMFINRATDIIHVAHCHFTPNAVTAYVADGSVGGDATVFRTECAQVAKVFHCGAVDGMMVDDVFAFGVRYFFHANTGTYTGDPNTSFGASFVNCACDGCYVAFQIERSSNPFPLCISNSWFSPLVRPTGVAGDAAGQAFIYYAASVANTRISVSNVLVLGTAVGEFSTNYSGQRDRDFGSAGALGSGNTVHVSGLHSLNYNTEIVGTALLDVVSLGGPTTAGAVAQLQRALVGFDTRAGGYYFSGTRIVREGRTGWSTPTATLSRATLGDGASLGDVTQILAALITDLKTHHGLLAG